MYQKEFATRTDLSTGMPWRTFSYSQFCSVFAEEFPDIKKAKHNLLSQCDLCALFKDESTRKLSKEDYAARREEYIKHLQMQSLLRMLYATRCEVARNPSSGSWTVVIDFASAQCKLTVIGVPQ
jgi:hypothetical protein